MQHFDLSFFARCSGHFFLIFHPSAPINHLLLPLWPCLLLARMYRYHRTIRAGMLSTNTFQPPGLLGSAEIASAEVSESETGCLTRCCGLCWWELLTDHLTGDTNSLGSCLCFHRSASHTYTHKHTDTHTKPHNPQCYCWRLSHLPSV